MRMRFKPLRAFQAHRPVAKRRALRRTAHDTDMLRHSPILRRKEFSHSSAVQIQMGCFQLASTARNQKACRLPSLQKNSLPVEIAPSCASWQ
jgi:hypothetical protein